MTKITPGGKGIEAFLNLPPIDDVIGPEPDEYTMPTDEEVEDVQEALAQAQTASEEARRQIAMLEGTDHGEAMDNIHRDVKKHASDLIDLAFNSDMKSTARIAEVAAQMYKVAIDAKNSKRDMQLKSMKLALDRQRLELEKLRAGQETPAAVGQEVHAEGVIIEDRNELIRRAREQLAKKG